MSATPPREDGRTARARATRARIVVAATELFVAGGYTSTSVGAIAAAAGVGEQTVYYSFKTKRAILAAAVDHAVAGDDEPVPTLDRAWVRDALADPDPASQLRRQVLGAADIHARAARLLDVVRGAAPSDPDLAALWTVNVEQRRTVQAVFIESLARKTTLRCDPDTAADTALAVLAPETYHLLITHRGWTADRWRDWATDALVRLLL